MDSVFEHAAEILLLFFLIITFLQSGIDKITDWKGNLGWLQGHFAESPLKNSVPLLLGIVTVAEVIAGLCCAAGVVQIVLWDETDLALYGALISCLSLLMLLLGNVWQRIMPGP